MYQTAPRIQYSEKSDTENLHKLVISMHFPSQYFSGGVSLTFKYKYLKLIPCNLIITSRHLTQYLFNSQSLQS